MKTTKHLQSLLVHSILLCLSAGSLLATETKTLPEQPRQADGTGRVVISGELKQWHKVTLTLDGPFADERDNEPNPRQYSWKNSGRRALSSSSVTT